MWPSGCYSAACACCIHCISVDMRPGVGTTICSTTGVHAALNIFIVFGILHLELSIAPLKLTISLGEPECKGGCIVIGLMSSSPGGRRRAYHFDSVQHVGHRDCGQILPSSSGVYLQAAEALAVLFHTTNHELQRENHHVWNASLLPPTVYRHPF